MSAVLVPQSWELFGDAILTGVLLAALLPLLGVLLVLRQQMFLALSVGQAANFGIAVALWLGFGAATGDVGGLVGGLVAAMLAAIAAMRALSLRATTLEARSAWIFLCAGSGAMLLLADAPHGMQQVQRLFLSSLLGASPQDPFVAGALLLVVVAGLSWRRQRLALWAMDPASAAAYGTSILGHDLLVGGFVGATIGFSIHATGLAFTFGCVVLPVLCARVFAPSLGAVVVLAPVVGVVGCGSGFLVADRVDLPPGQVTVVLLGGCVVVAEFVVAAWQRVRRLSAPRPDRAP